MNAVKIKTNEWKIAATVTARRETAWGMSNSPKTRQAIISALGTEGHAVSLDREEGRSLVFTKNKVTEYSNV